MTGKITKTALTLVLLLLAGLASAQPMVYTGRGASNYTFDSPFTACGAGPCQNFSTVMGTSGSFTTFSPLAGDLAGVNVASLVSGYTITDGLTTYAHTNPDVFLHEFEVTTNASGAVIDTNISVMRWLSGTAPHAAGDRISYVQTSNALTSGTHNTACASVGLTNAGAADGCLLHTNDGETSWSAGASVLWFAEALATPSIPVFSPWGMAWTFGLLGVAGFTALRRRRV